MRAIQRNWFGLAAVALAMFVSPAARAQLNSGPSTVALNATLSESLTLSVAPNTVNFTLVPNGTANGNSAVSITTTWVLARTRTTVSVYAYFTSTTALTDGGTPANTVATSKFNGNINGGAYSAFTGGSSPWGANSILVYTKSLGGAGTFNSSHTDTLGLQVDTTGLTLPAGTYTGTLNIQAQAI